MKQDHSDDYRLCSLEIRARYLLGLQDGMAMLQTTRMQYTNHAADPENPQAVPRVEMET
jgi:hypothetical protein